MSDNIAISTLDVSTVYIDEDIYSTQVLEDFNIFKVDDDDVLSGIQTFDVTCVVSIDHNVGTGGEPAVNYFVENGNTLELWWKEVVVQDWTVTPEAPPVGSPLGLLLVLTHSE